MIDRVEFHNFKALRDVSIDLERLTVLVGPNGSGKTSVLEGLCILLELGRGRKMDAIVRRRMPLEYRSAGIHEPLNLSLFFKDYESQFHINEEYITFKTRKVEGLLTPPISVRYSKFLQDGIPLGRATDPGPAILLRLDPARLTAPSYSEEAIPTLQPDGSGLASVLAYVAGNQPVIFQQLSNALHSVIPSFEAMRFPRAQVTLLESEVFTVGDKTYPVERERNYWGNSIEFDMVGAPQIPAEMVSEGTLLVLAILTAIMGPERPKLLLLDDLDRALHPKAQERLVGLLRKLLEQNPDLQIVATSHSPYLLDHLDFKEVRITAMNDDGTASVGRLDEHPKFEKWKDEMSPGEFWSLVGEQWLTHRVAEPRT